MINILCIRFKYVIFERDELKHWFQRGCLRFTVGFPSYETHFSSIVDPWIKPYPWLIMPNGSSLLDWPIALIWIKPTPSHCVMCIRVWKLGLGLIWSESDSELTWLMCRTFSSSSCVRVSLPLSLRFEEITDVCMRILSYPIFHSLSSWIQKGKSSNPALKI